MAAILGFAVVDASGRLLHSSGVTSVDHVGAGHWQIFFDFSVANACEVGSLGQFETAGYITAYGEPRIAPNEVTVWTYPAARESPPETMPTDYTFQLLVVG